MDPVSITASIIAILQVSNKVLEYLFDVRDAPEECRQCAMEASNLSGLLTSLRYLLQNRNSTDLWYAAVQGLGFVNGPLDQYKTLLERLCAKVPAQDGFAQMKQRLQWKFIKPDVDSILQRMERLKSLVIIALQLDAFKLSQAIQEGVHEMRGNMSTAKTDIAAIRYTQVSHQEQATLQWLSSLDFPAQQHDIISRKEEGTGQWFLDSPEFQTWLQEAKSTIFCPGIPGAGKTMVSAIAIQHLLSRTSNENIALGFLFCNYKAQAQQTCVMLLATLLKQLAHGCPDGVKIVARMHETHQKRNTKPSLEELHNALQSVCTMCPVVYLVIDALDEFVSQDRPRTVLIDKLQQLQTKADVRLMFTSRPIPEIKEKFVSDIKLEVKASDQDVRRYVASQITRLPRCVQRDMQLVREVQNKIADAVDGMFLLARLYVDSLVDKRTVTKARATLHTFGKRSDAVKQAYDDTLNKRLDPLRLAYDDAIQRIEAQVSDDVSLARQTLSWITYAQRPLTTDELCHALAIEPGIRELDSDAIYDIDDVLTVCAGLVTVDVESDLIRLVHYTTQDYLVDRYKEGWLPNAQLDITVSCFTYLTMDEFRSGPCDNGQKFEDRVKEFTFLTYAACHWPKHAAIVQREVWEYAGPFFRDQALVLAMEQAQVSQKQHQFRGYSQEYPGQITGLHLAARFGLVHLTAMLLEDQDYKFEADARDKHGRTPLSYAAERGHEAVVRLLVERSDVEADARDKQGRTPLSYAAERGHEAVVRLLVDRSDVEADARDKHGRTPLSYAAIGGYEAVVRLLVERSDVEADARDDNWGWTPLLWAAVGGHEAVVRLLVKRSDVEADARDNWGRTPLSRAVIEGNEAVVRLLVDRSDVEADTRDKHGRTPLSWAAVRGYEAVVRLLVDRSDVEADARDDRGRTPLSWAAKEGHERVVQLLTNRSDVEADAKDKDGRTPLSWAAEGRHEAVVRLLEQHIAQRNDPISPPGT